MNMNDKFPHHHHILLVALVGAITEIVESCREKSKAGGTSGHTSTNVAQNMVILRCWNYSKSLYLLLLFSSWKMLTELSKAIPLGQINIDRLIDRQYLFLSFFVLTQPLLCSVCTTLIGCCMTGWVSIEEDLRAYCWVCVVVWM